MSALPSALQAPQGVGEAPVADLRPLGAREAVAQGGFRVVAAVDSTPEAGAVARHGMAMARLLRTGVTLLRVLEVDHGGTRPPDPVAWSLRQQQARAELSALCAAGDVPVRLDVAEGRVVEECSREAAALEADLLVIGSRCPQRTGLGTLGSTARRLLERGDLNLMLVPPGAAPFAEGPEPARILVPLDGSAWSETALPLAIRLARGAGAALHLVHAVEMPDLPTLHPPEADDLQLVDLLMARALRRGEAFLARKRELLADQGLAVETHLCPVEDVRLAICDLARRHRTGLILLAARGAGRTRLAGLGFGHVTGWLAANCQQPVLVVGSAARRPPARRRANGGPPPRRRASW